MVSGRSSWSTTDSGPSRRDCATFSACSGVNSITTVLPTAIARTFSTISSLLRFLARGGLFAAGQHDVDLIVLPNYRAPRRIFNRDRTHTLLKDEQCAVANWVPGRDWFSHNGADELL